MNPFLDYCLDTDKSVLSMPDRELSIMKSTTEPPAPAGHRKEEEEGIVGIRLGHRVLGLLGQSSRATTIKRR